MPSRDPRSYVRVLPLPAPSDKFQAPSHASSKTNYQRRQEQISSQGFWSVNHKPYRGIGDPFYLDEKKLILHSLGQWDENEDVDRSSSSEDDDMQPSKTTSQARPMTAAKFVLRRTRTDLNTLHKDVANSRNLIRNVRLGYGFFDLIKQQQQAKNAAAIAEKRKKLEAARREWQPPKSDSDSESDFDEELDPDVNIARFLESSSEDETCDQMRNVPSSILDSDVKGRVTFSGMSARSRSASVGSRRNKVAPPRPYTPQHTNLSDVSSDDVEKDALFRQLCVLNWILEAMNTEHSSEMSPITQSWIRREIEIGGYRQLPPKVKQTDRPDKLKWEQMMSSNPSMKVKKSSIFKSRPLARRSTFLGPRSSVSPPPSSASSSQQLSSAAPQEKQSTTYKENTDSMTEDESTDASYNKSIFRFLDEYYESLRKESAQSQGQGQGQEDAVNINVSRMRKKSDAKTKETRTSEADGRTSKKSIKTPDLPITDVDDVSDKKQAFQTHREKKSLQQFRANLHMIRPRSTTALMDYKAQLPSNKHTPMTLEMRQKFSEVLEDKALSLHDILEQIDRDRMTKCQSKFMAMKAEGHNFHKNLRAMRLGSAGMTYRPTTEQLKKKSTFKGNWYTDLVSSIPEALKEKWFYKKILKKLANFGLPKCRRKSVKVQLAQVENTSKQSVYKFLKVLETIREWEICSPDISAAIEFCREKIVEMTVEEFEEWFCQQFPKIIRPQTAPPAHSNVGKRVVK
ncbi:coiled-coil domain-containing protein 60-like isoform X2 [Gigantopelta aegis]|uniref:coiled-coil domain-containing protein 60-like isoform X2 n=1 Tax=Gigantopelta aegis TaxID=1735272 RepID=UPI001B888D7F|nr:coiled-coil domain-containing protein 60-like isoform X2 [Gigantopelta aegis]